MYNLESISAACGNCKKYNNGYICCCPAHDDKNPSLSLWITKNDKLGAKCYAGCSYEAIISALKAKGFLSERKDDFYKNYNSPHPKDTKVPKVDNGKQEYIQKILRESNSNIEDTPVEVYLRKQRGIANRNIPATIRYHPELYHAETKKRYPAMVAVVQDVDGKTIGLHRTYLDSITNNKADISPNKMMLGNVAGGAVRLGTLFSPLIITEGIETGLSAHEATGLCVWAALSASGIENIIPPPITEVSNIIIAADNDANSTGINAALKAAQRLTLLGYTVNICKPENANDFNDLLRSK